MHSRTKIGLIGVGAFFVVVGLIGAATKGEPSTFGEPLDGATPTTTTEAPTAVTQPAETTTTEAPTTTVAPTTTTLHELTPADIDAVVVVVVRGQLDWELTDTEIIDQAKLMCEVVDEWDGDVELAMMALSLEIMDDPDADELAEATGVFLAAGINGYCPEYTASWEEASEKWGG
jgi:hypothetical protein